MEKKLKGNYKYLLIALVSIIILGLTFGIIDYKKIKNGEMPIFMIRVTPGSKSTHQYLGLGYRMERKTGVSHKEPIYSSDYVKFGFWIYTWNIEINKPAIDYVNKLEITNQNNCDNNPKLYYKFEDKKIYTYCLDSIKLTNNGNSKELKDFLENESIDINDIISQFTDNNQNSYDDGGTILYKGEDFNLLRCKTLDGNNDIYIGNKNMGYFNKFCKDNSISDNNCTNDKKGCNLETLEFYKDNKYKYLTDSNNPIIELNNGIKMGVKEALEKELVTINEVLNKDNQLIYNFEIIKEPNFILNPKKSNNCEIKSIIKKDENSIKTIDYNLYSNCLDEVKITINQNNMNLKEALLNSKITIEDIIYKMEFSSKWAQTIKTEYSNKAIKYSTLSYSFINCNNKLYYIGNSDMEYSSELCLK